MPSESEVLSTVTDIVARELGMPADTLTPDLDLRNAEGADSMKVLVMISRIERAYDIEIEDEDVFTLASINDVVRIVLATVATATV
ncbi:phosphopantetheine-binding protein [Frankia sp. CcI49]|uniref:Acyl carrier protein n=1 Tax=Parafrankia irregularis TaxID=795642 RepID=A0A0S4QPD3_9ACTN|nr:MULTISPECIES: phosphopantetheine-binding protein [Frankiaceae]MBE3200578.1 acyl carrier protein [Parafrankia sp. CH37]ONH61692.1 phosphopantetheine-binding protein [Frankia sp. CcI49]CUU56910.1 acyl carrier protein [Parafrankia irregularis]